MLPDSKMVYESSEKKCGFFWGRGGSRGAEYVENDVGGRQEAKEPHPPLLYLTDFVYHLPSRA